MEIKELLAGVEVCTCGKSHKCPIDYVIIAENACDSLPEITKEYRNILLVADKNTFAVGGATVSEKLGDRLADTLVYQTEELLSRPYYISADMSKYIALLIDTLNHDGSISKLLNPTDRIHDILKKYGQR